MEATQIFGNSAIYCFYQSAQSIRTLPTGSSASAAPSSYPTNYNICPMTISYDSHLENYDPSLTLDGIRDRLIAGVPIEDLTLTTMDVPIQIQFTFTEQHKIDGYRRDIKLLVDKKNKLTNERSINNINRRISTIHRNLAHYIKETEKKHFLKQAPKIVVKVVPKEPKEVSNVREELSAERMGRNRPDVINQLKNTLTRLESLNSSINAASESLANYESSPVHKNKYPMVENTLFEKLQILRWADKDEVRMTKTSLNKFSEEIISGMYHLMTSMAERLREAIGLKTGVLENMNESGRNNFLFHAIAKGRDFYYQSLADPEFCLYLVDNWQPLHTYMSEKL